MTYVDFLSGASFDIINNLMLIIRNYLSNNKNLDG